MKTMICDYFYKSDSNDIHDNFFSQNLPPVEVDGYLDRKQELQTGGKRATIRLEEILYNSSLFILNTDHFLDLGNHTTQFSVVS